MLIQITSAEIHVVTDNPMVIQVFWSFSLGIGCVFQENTLKCAKLPTNWTENLRQQVLLGDQSKFKICIKLLYLFGYGVCWYIYISWIIIHILKHFVTVFFKKCYTYTTEFFQRVKCSTVLLQSGLVVETTPISFVGILFFSWSSS